MRCASCGLEIADKAIVCYRCGTPTANPGVHARGAAGRGRPNWAIAPLMVAIMALAVWLIPKTTPGTPPRIAAWVVTWLAVFTSVSWFRGRRR